MKKQSVKAAVAPSAQLVIGVMVDGQLAHVQAVNTLTFSASKSPIQGAVQIQGNLDPLKATELCDAAKAAGFEAVADSSNSWNKRVTYGKGTTAQSVDLASIFG